MDWDLREKLAYSLAFKNSMNSKASVKVYSSTPSGQVAEIQYLSTGSPSLRTMNFHSDLKTGLSLYLDKPLSI